MHAEIAGRKDEIARICRRYGVQRLDLFGSAARGTDFDPETSDADFLVEFQPPLLPGIARRVVGLQMDLAEALGRKVDLVRMGTVRRPRMQAYIDLSRETVYAAPA
ncbi:MAG: nucleotidyltransferase domain-containing protein [Alphaproteobacteria bacterium]|nr:nucleotidyltransferase domain-containing protein [Alphaproteobacteria bacterium]